MMTRMTGRLQRRSMLLMVLAMIVLLAACAAPGPQETPTSLEHWVEQDLTPYVLRQVNSHPRFRGQSLLIASMKNGVINSEIDDLTRHIRSGLVTALSRSAAVDRVHRPLAAPSATDTHVGGVACRESHKVDYLLGISAVESPVDGALVIMMQAIDTQANRVIPGFEISWRGHPAARQRRSLARRTQDEYLRGLRALPFTESQPDLLAYSLARDIGCLLNYAEHGGTRIYIARSEALAQGFFASSLELMMDYLAGYENLRITQDAQQAEIVLDLNVQHIHKGLHQATLSLRNRDATRTLPGAEAQAYVRLSAPINTGLTKAELEADDGNAADFANFGPSGQTDNGGRPQQRAVAPVTKTDSGRTSSADTLINSFELLTPASAAQCATSSPWARGERVVAAGEVLTNGACLAARIAVNRKARLILIRQESDGELKPFLTPQCGRKSQPGYVAEAGRNARLPANRRNTRVLVHDNDAGEILVYAIAIAEAATTKQMRSLVRLVETPAGLYNNRHYRVSAQEWQHYLNSIASSSRDHLEWRVIRIGKHSI